MNDTILCCCLGNSEEDLRNDYPKNGHALIRERIAAEKKAGNGSCVETNPTDC